MAIIRLIVTLKILLCYDQPDDGHELAETCRCTLIRIYFSSYNCCGIDYLQHIYFYTHNGDDIP